jgi:putative ABC transport system ATP-binding protein
VNIIAESIGKNFNRGKSKASFNVLDDISLELNPGELVILTGKSGSGKSTLLNILSGLLKPTEGKVTYGEKNIYELNDKELSAIRNDDFGYITQIQSPISSLTVIQNVLLPLTLFDTKTDYYDSENEYNKRAVYLLKRLGIDYLKDAMPSELSGGELKRMMIARSLIKNPKHIFADEPTADLDNENTVIVLELLKDYASHGSSVIIATHENEAKEYADKQYYFEGQKLKEA